MTEEFKFDKKEESGKSVNDEIVRNISFFVDMLEIVNMHRYSSAICFSKAFEGLVNGMIAKNVLNYCDEYDEKMTLDQLLAKVNCHFTTKDARIKLTRLYPTNVD